MSWLGYMFVQTNLSWVNQGGFLVTQSLMWQRMSWLGYCAVGSYVIACDEGDEHGRIGEGNGHAWKKEGKQRETSVGLAENGTAVNTLLRIREV